MFINNFDPVAFQIFSFEIRWYSLAYVFGIILGWFYCKKKLIKDQKILNLFDDLITYLIIGIIVGGRLGYVVFYNLEYYLENFSEILMIWSLEREIGFFLLSNIMKSLPKPSIL